MLTVRLFLKLVMLVNVMRVGGCSDKVIEYQFREFDGHDQP